LAQGASPEPDHRWEIQSSTTAAVRWLQAAFKTSSKYQAIVPKE
jgi:hypothetical protein